MIALPPPDSFDDHTLTEYAETLMLCEDETHLSLAELASRFAAGQRPTSLDLGLIRSEINRSAHLFPEIYPYRADDEGIERLSGSYDVYDFLLLLSAESAPYRTQRRFSEINPLFDFLVREAIRSQLSSRAVAVRFGTPVRDGRPQGFPDAIAWLAEKMGVALLQTDLLPDENDHGVDVIAWKPFASGRSGFPVWLIQTTVQMEYTSKARDIPVMSWLRTLDIGPYPGTALAIPFSVADGDDRWLKVSMQVTQPMDRVRICEQLAGVDLSIFPELAEISAFVIDEKRRWPDSINDPTVTSPRTAKPRRQSPSAFRDPLRR